MLKLLKEMGKVCENKKLCSLFQDFHKEKFNSLYLVNKEQAESHKEKFLFWLKQSNNMKKHIDCLHEKIRRVG